MGADSRHSPENLLASEGELLTADPAAILAPPMPDGSVQRRWRAPALVMHRAAVERDEPRFFEAAKLVLETRGGAYEESLLVYSRKCFEPLFNSPFRLTRDYVRSLVEGTRDMKQLIWKKDSNVVPLPEGLVFLNRLQFGFYSVLARLDVDVDYARVESEFLRDA